MTHQRPGENILSKLANCTDGNNSPTPYQEAFNELSLFRVVDTYHSCEGQIVWLSKDDGDDCPRFSSHMQDIQHHFLSDLKELPKDADGFYLREGGECPVPGDWEVLIKFVDGRKIARKAGDLNWNVKGVSWVIIAFKPISRPDMPLHSEAVDQDESTVSAEDQGDILGDNVSALDVQEGYEKLAAALQGALDQAQGGKGAERHAQGQPFHEQPMQRISQLVGSRDGMAFQAIKKIQESQRFDDTDRIINELRGAINYVAGMIIYLEAEALEQQENKQ